MDRIAVAFSGGADSSFLLKLLADALGRDNVAAFTAKSEFVTGYELREARKLAKALGVKHSVVRVNLLRDPKIAANTPLRCYYCKKRIFSEIKGKAAKAGYRTVVDASNRDDSGDYRPGRRALKELGILSPLKSAGMAKAEIRALSKQLGLPTWDKPANACLATRIPCGERITARKLKMAEKAERILGRVLGRGLLRVRCHGDIARIEVPRSDIRKALAVGPGTINKLRSIGFRHITVDLNGYRTGSMNPERKS